MINEPWYFSKNIGAWIWLSQLRLSEEQVQTFRSFCHDDLKLESAIGGLKLKINWLVISVFVSKRSKDVKQKNNLALDFETIAFAISYRIIQLFNDLRLKNKGRGYGMWGYTHFPGGPCFPLPPQAPSSCTSLIGMNALT